MDRDGLQRWLDRYVEAWRMYDPELIGSLFSDDARYHYHPWDDPLVGRAAIVQSWMEPGGSVSGRDDPRSWHARYAPLAVDGAVAVATGITTYVPTSRAPGRVYRNLWVMRFDDDDRCTDFTEWFMQEPDEAA